MKSDGQLQQDVMAELEWEPRIDHADIGVAVNDGVVTLTGLVKSFDEKQIAERAVQHVSGVRAIAEEIKVRYDNDRKTADSEIAKRILDIFSWSALTPDDGIGVKVENGWVTLTGLVDWHFQAAEARLAAGKISGVVGIVNQIQLRQHSTTGDIHQRIVAAFERQADLDATGVTIALDGNTVTLGGKVKAWHERLAAERAAWSAPGVTGVEDHIMVA
jgi:osmotically-inducible protein OsmY